MDKFINTLDKTTFESTNGLWNDLMLNSPWSVGYVSSLIEMRTFHNKEEWENFYYESGKKRDIEINKLSPELQKNLQDEQLILRNKAVVHQLSWSEKNLNYHFGRTKDQLDQKANILFQETQKKAINITQVECLEAVRFRVICQTWNGIIIRERNTLSRLKNEFSNIDFLSTTGDFDHQFAVDYELKLHHQLICGIQIKPKSYLGNAPYLKKAQVANQRKNQEYQNKYGKPVLNVISKSNGEIINKEVIEKIADIISHFKVNNQ